MNAICFLLLLAAIIAAVTIVNSLFIMREKAKKTVLSRICLENFLGDLAKCFYDSQQKFLSKPLDTPRTDEEIASYVAKEISQNLDAKLQAMLSNLTVFHKKQRKSFSTDDSTNHFVDKMIPNLSVLYLQYSNKLWISSLDNCRFFLFKIAKMKTLEVLKDY